MKIIFSPQASEDIDALFSYIKDALQNPFAAHNTVNKILQRLYILSSFSSLGQRIEVDNDFLQSYRFLIVSNYLVVYKITDRDMALVRVFYARSDYKKLLKN